MSSRDPRFEELAAQLRAAKPTAPPELRERVAALEPAERRRWAVPRLSARRAALVLVPACVVAAVGAAVIHGVVTSGKGSRQSRGHGTFVAGRVPNPRGVTQMKRLEKLNPPATSFAPSRRLQRYDVRLRLRVRNLDRLSDATRNAISTTRRLGGYVASVNYAAPTAKRGGASLVLMVPIDRVQEAIQRLSGLGTILAQHVSVQDLQRQVNEETSVIARLRRQIARIKATLAHGSLSAEQRLALEQRLAVDQRRLRGLRGTKEAAVRRAAFAQIKLALVTKEAAAAHPSRLGRTFRDAVSVLGREGELLLYVLVVAGPLALLAALGIATVRSGRRRAEARLLERT